MGQEGVGFCQAGQLTSGKLPIRPQNQILAPVGHEDLVGLRERVKEAEEKLAETELEDEEARVPKAHSRKFTPSIIDTASPTCPIGTGVPFVYKQRKRIQVIGVRRKMMKSKIFR